MIMRYDPAPVYSSCLLIEIPSKSNQPSHPEAEGLTTGLQLSASVEDGPFTTLTPVCAQCVCVCVCVCAYVCAYVCVCVTWHTSRRGAQTSVHLEILDQIGHIGSSVTYDLSTR